MSIDNVLDVTPRIQYVALAAQTAFDYPFPIFQDADLVVDVDGVTKTLSTHYTVTGEGEDTGGTVTFLVAMAGGEIVTIYRDIAIERTSDFQQNGPLRSATFNDELDRITLILQQLEAADLRSIRLPPTTEADSTDTQLNPATWANTYLSFNASGIPTPAALTSSGAITHALIGAVLYPAIAREGSAVVNPGYPYGHIRRYGNTLNQAAIEAALTANAGYAVYLSGGETHTLTGPITVPANTDIFVDNDGIATIDASGASITGNGLIVCVGSISSSLGGGLSGTVTKGDLTVPFNNSSHGLAAGDLIVIHNTTNASWNAASADARQGEFLVVKSVSGATITLASAVLDTYSSSCVVYKITPTTTRIKGKITIIGNTADTANLATIYVQYGRGTQIEGLRFLNSTATCIEHIACFMPSVYSVETGKYLADTGSIQATGVVFAGCQYASCRDSVLIASRHGGSTGGGGIVVDRFNVFDHCFLASRNARAADFHPSSEFCSYVRCHIDGGAVITGARNRIIDCDIYPHATATNLIFLEVLKSIDNTIERNRLYMQGSVVANAIDASSATCINSSTTEGGVLRILNNVILDTTTSSHAYVNLRNNGSTASLSVALTDNQVNKSDTSTFGNMLSVSVISGSNFEKITYSQNIHNGNTGFGVVANLNTLRIDGECGWGDSNSSSPSFGSATFEPSHVSFEKVIDVSTAANAFGVFNVSSGNSFVPDTAAARANVNITATTGNFMALGVDAANRRVDFGVSAAAASSQFVKNTKIRFINSSERTNQMVDAGEGISLMSVDVNTDGAVLASNMGGASQSVNVRISGRMVGNLVSVP